MDGKPFTLVRVSRKPRPRVGLNGNQLGCMKAVHGVRSCEVFARVYIWGSVPPLRIPRFPSLHLGPLKNLSAVWKGTNLRCFVAQTSTNMKGDAEAFSLLAVSLVIIFIRLAARISTVGLNKLQSDDYLMLLAGSSPPVFHGKRRRSWLNVLLVSVHCWDHLCPLCSRFRGIHKRHDDRQAESKLWP